MRSKRGFTPSLSFGIVKQIYNSSPKRIGFGTATFFGIKKLKTSQKFNTKVSAGFTLLELIIVVAIIGLLTAIILVAVDASKAKGRDANRGAQLQEFLKAFELYYLENGAYPTDGVADADKAIPFIQGSGVGNALAASGYLSFVPPDPKHSLTNGYLYCASNDNKSMALLVNTEQDNGGTDYCVVSRGRLKYSSGMCTVPEPAGSLTNIGLASIDLCSTRF